MTNITEAPEAPGGLLATGWDTPLVHPTTAEYALGEHACHLAAQRDAALGTAARLHAENQRLHAELRAMRGRVAGQRETIRRLRRDVAPAVLARIDEALAKAVPGPGVPDSLEPWDASGVARGVPGVDLRGGRWLPWVRAMRARDER